MSIIHSNLQEIRRQIAEAAAKCGRSAEDITLVAVSKRFPAEAIQEALAAGQAVFGENYLQEAAAKRAVLGKKVRFHFIGHLQSNKAKLAAETFDVIETVDRIKIAAALNRNLEAIDRKLDILIQVNVGLDAAKSGVLPDQTAALLEQVKEFRHLRPKGLMTMPPLSNNSEESRVHFRNLHTLAKKMQSYGLLPEKKMELSMGMSGDFPIAIEEGATLLRIGTAIFGKRPPK